MTPDRQSEPFAEVARIFVGRERELEELTRGIEEAGRGHGRLFLIAGEPGIGKTRLASEVTGAAQRQGAQAFSGRCWEGGGAPPFWPWVQVIRSVISNRNPQSTAQKLGSQAALVTQMIPELREHLPTQPAPSAPSLLESEHVRFYVFDAVTRLLKDAAREQTLVLLFDDLHAADRPSLLLLQFLARELSDSRLLIIGTYRDVDARRDPTVNEVLTDLARDGQRLSLGGLSESEVTRLLEKAAGLKLPEALARTVHRATEGNPLFVDEIVRTFLVEGRFQRPHPRSDILRIPDGVKEAIRRRLSPLAEKCHDVLAVAAVAGREFDVTVLQVVCERPLEQVLEVLDEAFKAGVVAQVSQPRGHYRFSHALFRETLYEDLSSARRLALHRSIAEAVERLRSGGLEAHLGELAYHFYEAAGVGDPDKAVEYGRRAGQRAFAQFAYEDAAGHYERALEALTLRGDAADRDRCDLLLALGDCRRKAGETQRAKETFELAIALARKLKAPEALVPAVLGYTGMWTEGITGDERTIRYLEEALAILGSAESSLQPMVMGRLANELVWLPESSQRCVALAQQAVEVARRLGEPRALSYALNSRLLSIWGAGTIDDTAAIGAEIVAAAREAGDDELVVRGYEWRVAGLLEVGKLEGLDSSIQAVERRAKQLRQPFLLWSAGRLRAMRALLDGRLEDAERLAQEALAVGQVVEPSNATRFYGAQLFALNREQGRVQELEEPLRSFLEQDPGLVAWRCGLAFVYADLGRQREASREFELLAANDFLDLPRRAEWAVDMAVLAEVSSFLGDQHRAAKLYEILLPLAGRSIVAGVGLAYFGSVAHYLGLLARTMRRWREAEEHFGKALEVHMRLHANPFIARTRYEFARMLLARGEPADAVRATELVEQALTMARELGLKDLEEKVAAIGGAARTLVPVSKSSGTPTDAGFHDEGDYWAISFEGNVCRLKNVHGLHYLLHLLRHAGQEFHVSDLVVSVDRLGSAEDMAAAVGDAGEVLDAKAKAAYRQRLDDLKEGLSEAQRFNDPERASRALQEIEQITEQLAGAVGLGGRDRRAASVTERVRLRVTKAIKYAIAKIEELSPPLGGYLNRNIKTGTFCSYSPDPRSPVRWTF